MSADARPGGRRGAVPAPRTASGGRLGELSTAVREVLHGSRESERTFEWALLAVVTGALIILGLLMTFSASFVQGAAEGAPFSFFIRQLLGCALGVPVLILAARSDYRAWRPLAAPLLLLGLLLSALVLVPAIGIEAYGARRWLGVGPVTIQPSELLKVAVPLYVAHVVARRWRRIRDGDLHALLMPALPAMAAAAALIMGGPDLETAGLVIVIGGLCLFTAGLPARLIGGAGLVFLASAAYAIFSTEFRRARMLAWFDPTAFPDSHGYQSLQGFIALGSGGWFGVGLGQGRGKWLYIPNAHTDFIFAIIGEELGLVGAMAVLLLIAALAVGGVRTARRAADPFGRLLAVGITGWLLLQGGMNIGSVVGLLPVTGVTLPLVSFGGSSLVFTMLGVGLLLSVARHPRSRQVEP